MSPLGHVFSAEPVTQTPEFLVRSWQTREGLPQNSAQTLAQTGEGYLWIGTRGGLARFDGVRFTTYGLADGLKSLNVYDLASDGAGGVWIGTNGGGLSRWHNGRISTLTTADGLAHNDVTAVVPAADGGAWVGTKLGLQHWGPDGFRRVGEKEGLLTEVIHMAVTPKGGLWVSVEETGLFYCENGQCQRVEGPPEHRLHGYALLVDREGDLWISIGNGTILRHRLGKWKVYTTDDGLPFNFIFCLTEGAGGEIWAGSQEEGLYLFRDGKFHLVPGTDSAVRALQMGRDGEIWVGTQTDGLTRLIPRKLTEYRVGQGKSRGQVNGLLEESPGKFWVGTYGGGLFHGGLNELTKMTGVEMLDDRPFHQAALKMSDGTLVFGGPRALHRRNPANAEFETHKIPGTVTALLEDTDGSLLFGTREGELNRWPRGAAQPAEIETFPARISGLISSPGEGMWIGTIGGGLYLKGANQTRRWTVADGLPTDMLRGLYRDQEGTLWIGTSGGGLAWFTGDCFHVVDSRRGLGDDVISQILEDDKGNLWLGCNRGIFRVSKAELKAVAAGSAPLVHPLAFDESDGMLVPECTGGYAPAGLRGSSNLLYFSTVRGVAVVDPAKFTTAASPPQARIEEILRDGQPFDFDKGPARLGPGLHAFEIHFTAFDSIKPEHIRFRYRLHESDSEWTEVNQKRFVNFFDLPPGNYRFQVSAANQDGHWGPPASTPPFTVLPYFWETSWFRTAIVAGVMGCGALVVLAFARSKIRQARASERLAQAEAKARHHLNELSHLSRVTLVGEMATSLAHELNQPLAAIVANAGAAQRFLEVGKGDPAELHEILDDIGADGLRAGEVIRGIKGMVRRAEGERRPINLNDVIAAVMRLVRADARNHGCALVTNPDESVPTILGDFVQLQQVLLNLIINAFDAMSKTPLDLRRIEITSQCVDASAKVSVRDTGPGLSLDGPERVFERFFSTKREGMGMGLAISRFIIEEHSGKIGAENAPGGGAYFWFELPARDEASDGEKDATEDAAPSSSGQSF